MCKIRKLILMLLIFLSFIFTTTDNAHAYAIYDWVMKERGTLDQGFTIKASFLLSDLEFTNGTFEIKNHDNDFLGFVDIPLTDGWSSVRFFVNWVPWDKGPTSCSGVLSSDRKRIKSFLYTTGPVNWTNRLDTDDSLSGTGYLTIDRIIGGIGSGSEYGFNEKSHPLAGITAGKWDQYGEWGLRDPSPVPEPSSVFLVAAGLLLFTALHRKALL